MEDKILIFIPMYRCEKQIPRVLAQIARLGEGQKRFAEVLVVDNGSPDESIPAAARAIRELSIPARVVRNRENYSLGGSHKVAFLYAITHGFTHVVVLHGDDQGCIDDLLPILDGGLHRQADSLLGSRFMKQSRLSGYSRFRVFGNLVFNAAVSVLSGRAVKDLGSGLNIYQTRYLEDKFFLPFPNDLTFNVYLLLYGAYVRSRFDFFPISWREEDQVSNARLWSQSKRILGLALSYAANRQRLFRRLVENGVRQTYEYDIVAQNKEAEAHE